MDSSPEPPPGAFLYGTGLAPEKFAVLALNAFFFPLLFFGRVAHGILPPQPGVEPRPPAVEVQCLNH